MTFDRNRRLKNQLSSVALAWEELRKWAADATPAAFDAYGTFAIDDGQASYTFLNQRMPINTRPVVMGNELFYEVRLEHPSPGREPLAIWFFGATQAFFSEPLAVEERTVYQRVRGSDTEVFLDFLAEAALKSDLFKPHVKV